ncbi:hypothetical protein RG959_01705 [Domibacillus sp. 8LH]|uniref:hypothetical protein n=1 Tax=Domibacillus sp. 8LH TaxID=3073900 RepID=UPI00317AC964
MNRLKLTIMSVATVTTDVMTRINSAMEGTTMRSFFAWLEGNAARSLSNFATMAGNSVAENKEYTNGSGRTIINLNVAYNCVQKLDKAEMDRFAAYMNRKLAEVMNGGA